MARDFTQISNRPVRNVKQFLREAADTGIKYTAERGARHHIYIPSIKEVDADGNPTNSLIAMSDWFHDIVPEPDKYENTICLSGKVLLDDKGEMINDGTCPFCDRVGDAWAIRNYRLEKEEKSCGLTGDALVTHLKTVGRTYLDERKVKEKTAYIYILIVKFKLGDDQRTPVMGQDNLPEYELKVAKWSVSRVQKIQDTLENGMMEMEGSEIVFKYEDSDDRRRWTAGAATTPIQGQAKMTERFPGLIDKINAEVGQWKWEGIDTSFKEWKGYSTAEATSKCNELFKAWDSYIADLGTSNEHAYLETKSKGQANNPALETQPQVNTPVGIEVGIPVGGQATGNNQMFDPNLTFGTGGLAGQPAQEGQAQTGGATSFPTLG